MITLRREMVEGLAGGDVATVLARLQDALCLEHATIPPYLYTLYSLDPEKNPDITDIISSVVIEEMLHMVLVANIINALGGTPKVDDPDLLPRYPGHLPGAVEGDLKVRLARCSLDHIRDVFMKIEEPDHPLQFQAFVASPSVTIGQFYATVKDALAALGDGAFSATPRNQIGPDTMDDAIVVVDVASASMAIDTIVHQGEGTTVDPGEVVGMDWAHYYRFEEIVRGHRLIHNDDAPPDAPPDQQWVYKGAEIDLDPTGVAALPTDPSLTPYPVGTREHTANRLFNYTYTSLLHSLQTMLTGAPEQFSTAFGLMMSLKQQARDMADANSTDVPAGPTFEYQPVLEPEPTPQPA